MTNGALKTFKNCVLDNEKWETIPLQWHSYSMLKISNHAITIEKKTLSLNVRPRTETACTNRILVLLRAT